jgi:ribonuclease VapC
MTLDTSALVAVLFSEPGYLDIVDRILEADLVRVAAPTLVETSLVFAGRRGQSAGRASARTAEKIDKVVDDLVKELGVTVVPFGEPEWHRAVEAFARYGRGRHKASLNFGDCLAYATASLASDSLLFVGEDFRHTDLPPAM